MNVRYVVNQWSLLLLGFGMIMALIAGLFFGIEGALEHEVDATARVALFISAAIGLAVGGLTWQLTRKGSRRLGRREALLLVSLSWVVGAAFAALPFFLWGVMSDRTGPDHPFRSFISCYFEATSGLTTTGATVLSDIEAIPRSLLLWRAITHWLGGLGIVVLFVAVLPSLGVGGKKLFRIEAPGPSPEGLSPQIRDTARVLWYIYLGLTAAQIAALMLAGMNLFESICHTCATLATGGFSTRNASIGAYDATSFGPAATWAIQIIVVVFMVLAGMNFGLYYQVIRGRIRTVLRDPEMRLYLVLLMLGSLIVFAGIVAFPLPMTTGQEAPRDAAVAAREAIFTTVSIQTTTGFCTSDFNRWPFISQAVLVMLMFVGGCAGSTGGGIKVIRIWVAFKVMISEVERVFRPNVIRPVKLGSGTIDPELKLGTVTYVLGIIVLFVLGSGAVMLLEQANPDSDCSYTTAATASVATLCTIGAVENYGWFSPWSKAVLCLLMVLGRLEVMAIAVLFTPRFWRTE
ncbi:MAG: TrkH family potassium uptake protein [Planctomycetota bacterium]